MAKKLISSPFIALFLVITMALSTAVFLSSCDSESALLEILQNFLSKEEQTETSRKKKSDKKKSDSDKDDPDNGDETEPTESSGKETTEPLEELEIIKNAEKHSPLLWEVGDSLYYIDLNDNVLYRHTDVYSSTGDVSVNLNFIAHDAHSIAGFSDKRIFYLFDTEKSPDGHLLRTLTAINPSGANKEVILQNINNAAVLDDNTLLISYFDEETSSSGAPAYLEIALYNIKKDTMVPVFIDDGNDFFDWVDIDFAYNCHFFLEDDGVRLEMHYPGYSEIPFVRYLLFDGKEIVADSKAGSWRDSSDTYLYHEGYYEILQEIKQYDQLTLFARNSAESSFLIYDHPDKYYEILSDSPLYLNSFFYHQGKVVYTVYDTQMEDIEYPYLSFYTYDPQDDSIVYHGELYESLFQTGDFLLGFLAQTALSDYIGRHNEDVFVQIDMLDADANNIGSLFDDWLLVGYYYDGVSYSTWQTDHNFVFYYTNYFPDEGPKTSPIYNWIIINPDTY